MQKLYEITIPGLSMKGEFAAVRRRRIGIGIIFGKVIESVTRD
jgi:hypothetical protein